MSVQQLGSYAQLIREWQSKGYLPATSGNFSMRDGELGCYVTASGRDKQFLEPSDFIQIDLDGNLRDPSRGVKSSAETRIHLCIYQAFDQICYIGHTHSPYATLLSQYYHANQEIVFQGWEILKGFRGVEDHLGTEVLPIIANSQDMGYFEKELPSVFESYPALHGFLIAGHGLYTWGESLNELKRHLEVWEFLFKLEQLQLGLEKA